MSAVALAVALSVATSLACAHAVAAGSQSGQGEPSAATADVQVKNVNDLVVLRLGQTVGLRPPMANAKWQVDYDEDALRLVTPAEKAGEPGDRGWVWKSAKAGKSEIVLTSKVPCSTPGCTPNVARFTIQVEITAKSPNVH